MALLRQLHLTRLAVPWGRTGVAVGATTRIRWGRSVAIAATVLLLLFAALELEAVVRGQASRGQIGGDLAVHLAVARRWVETGVLYSPTQLAGPYAYVNAWRPDGVVNLYPPPTVLLFVPFLLMPAILWWLIPLGIVAAGLIYWRPSWWSWPILAAALVPLPFSASLSTGNTTMWVVAALMLATRWPSAAILLALKPAVLPFAIPFVRYRSWWLAALVFGLVSLLFLPSWPLWWLAVQNLEGTPLLLYAWPGIPLFLFPFVVKHATSIRRAAVP